MRYHSIAPALFCALVAGLALPAAAACPERCGDVAPAGGPDGVVTVADCVLGLRWAVGLDVPGGEQLVGADVAPADVVDAGSAPVVQRARGDGLVNVADVVVMLRVAVELSRLQECAPAPRLCDVRPAAACVSAGHVLALRGRRLTGDATAPVVRVGGVTATIVGSATDASGTEPLDILRVATGDAGAALPPGGSVDVEIVTPRGASVLEAAVRLDPSCADVPRIVGSEPLAGPLEGGTVVSLSGSGLSCVSDVTFLGNESGGMLAAEVVEIGSDGLVRVVAPVSPRASPESWDIVLTTPCGSATVAAGWEYVVPDAVTPDATSVIPAQGPAAGGNEVTLLGTGLDAATRVDVGGSPLLRDVDFFVESPTRLVIPFMPPGPRGADVSSTESVVAMSGGLEDETPLAYAYVGASAECLNVVPDSGPRAGGTRVFIAGTQLAAVDSVLFGAAAGASLTHPNENSVMVTTPSRPTAGTVTVTLRAGATTLATCQGGFAYE